MRRTRSRGRPIRSQNSCLAEAPLSGELKGLEIRMNWPTTPEEAADLFQKQITECGEHRLAVHLREHQITPYLVQSHEVEFENGKKVFPVWIIVEDEAANRFLGLVADPWEDKHGVRWIQSEWLERTRPDLSTSPLFDSLILLIKASEALGELPQGFFEWATRDC